MPDGKGLITTIISAPLILKASICLFTSFQKLLKNHLFCDLAVAKTRAKWIIMAFSARYRYKCTIYHRTEQHTGSVIQGR